MTEKDDKSHSEDKQLWERVTRTIKPLNDRPEPPHREKKQKTKKTQRTEKTRPQETEIPTNHELDHRTAQRLKKGQIRPEYTLDLHGMTQIQAHTALNEHIPRAYALGKRCILIITGKGTTRSSDQQHKPGILKQRAPEWLSEPPLNRYVLKLQPAHRKDGGEGAFYVYLRRARS